MSSTKPDLNSCILPMQKNRHVFWSGLKWHNGHKRYQHQDPTDKKLNEDITSRIGFNSAKKVMREIVLEDTVKRLPDVLSDSVRN